MDACANQGDGPLINMKNFDPGKPLCSANALISREPAATPMHDVANDKKMTIAAIVIVIHLVPVNSCQIPTNGKADGELTTCRSTSRIEKHESKNVVMPIDIETAYPHMMAFGTVLCAFCVSCAI